MQTNQRTDFHSDIPEFNLTDLPSHPLLLFTVWYERVSEVLEKDSLPNSMCLSTVSPSGRPRSRWVLMREYSQQGYYFYTDYNSDKSKDIDAHPDSPALVGLNFYWEKVHQQIRIEGRCEKVSDEKSDEYFYSRPFANQVSAAASAQSKELQTRKELESKVVEISEKYEALGRVPRPTNWGGYRVIPDYYEFWQGRESRLHERVVYICEDEHVWTKKLIQP